MTHAVFLDRDGVINNRIIGDYVRNPEQFRFLPEIFQVLPEIHAAGYLAIVITNQRGIGRGLMSREDLEMIHRAMQEELQRRTGHCFDAIYYCPHNHPDDCDCRKPLPGMILQAAAEHHIDLPGSWMIGDSESDIKAGIAAGCHTARIAPLPHDTCAEIASESLREAWREIQGRTEPETRD